MSEIEMTVDGFEVHNFEDGWASFEVNSSVGCDIWAMLANIAIRKDSGFRNRFSWGRSNTSVAHLKEWANLVRAHASFEEGDNAPCTSVEEGQTSITLGWDGTWTRGRQVRIQIFPGEDTAYVRFKTGTEENSSFLSNIFISAKAEADGETKEVVYAPAILAGLVALVENVSKPS